MLGLQKRMSGLLNYLLFDGYEKWYTYILNLRQEEKKLPHIKYTSIGPRIIQY